VLELAKKHGTIHDELQNRFSTTDQRITKLETAITRFRPKYRDYDDYDYCSDTEDVVCKLIDDVRTIADDPVQAMRLLVKIFEKDSEVMESANQYEDSIGEVFTNDATNLFEELAKQIDDKKYIEDILYKLLPYDDYGTRMDLEKNIKRSLPVANIKSLAQRLCHSERKTAGNYGLSSTRSLVQRLLETISDPAFTAETLLLFDGKETPERCFDTGKAYFTAKNYLKAKEWFDKLPANQPSNKRNQQELLEMLKVIHAKRQDKPALAETLRELLKYKRTKGNFTALVKAVGEKGRATLIEEQVAEVSKNSKSKGISYKDVEFLTAIGAVDVAENLLWRRLSVLPSHSSWGNEPLSMAKLMESKKRPLIATAIYRKIIDDILTAAKSKDYPTAILCMKALSQLAPTIKNWQSLDSHEKYVEKLRAKFPKRPSFWSDVK
jgi:tetratricopeptide (TPR) repeat protein